MLQSIYKAIISVLLFVPSSYAGDIFGPIDDRAESFEYRIVDDPEEKSTILQFAFYPPCGNNFGVKEILRSGDYPSVANLILRANVNSELSNEGFVISGCNEYTSTNRHGASILFYSCSLKKISRR